MSGLVWLVANIGMALHDHNLEIPPRRTRRDVPVRVGGLPEKSAGTGCPGWLATWRALIKAKSASPAWSPPGHTTSFSSGSSGSPFHRRERERSPTRPPCTRRPLTLLNDLRRFRHSVLPASPCCPNDEVCSPWTRVRSDTPENTGLRTLKMSHGRYLPSKPSAENLHAEDTHVDTLTGISQHGNTPHS